MKSVQFLIKTLLDRFLALVAIICLSPILLIAAVGIKLSSKGPIIYKANRMGKNVKPITVYKFRTMESHAGCEPVATRLGMWLRRLSLDEVPQMVNVLKGDMSIVGPRPLPVAYLPRYSPEQSRRHEVRPGITGWAQVHGRNALTWPEKFRYDVEYVDRHSLLMDMRILLLTVPAAFAGGDDMPEFKG